jgi:hypothetical protein
VNSSQQNKPMPNTLRMIPTMIMVDTSVTKGQTVAPSTTTTARQGISLKTMSGGSENPRWSPRPASQLGKRLYR